MLLVVVAAVLAGWRVAHAELPLGGTVGADASGISLVDADGEAHRLGEGRRTVVLVFNSRCGHCAREAPAWRAWLAEHRDLRTVAVSTDTHPDAVEFSTRHEWSTDVFTVAAPWFDTETKGFMARTPWIHVVSPTGIIEASMYGGELDTLDRIIANHPPSHEATQ